MNDTKMIKCENIHKSYGTLEVLRGVSLEVSQGEVVSVVGPSGAGKTTLLQIMGTLSPMDSGRLEIDGVDVSSMGDDRLSDFRNRHIGFVFQFHHLLPEFTALENVIARAIVNRPSILLADEPSGNLDSKNREQVHALFFRLRDELGQTCVVVTHDDSLASMADRKIVMSDGMIL